MIGIVQRQLRKRRLRAQIAATFRAFASEPQIIKLAALYEEASPECRSELVRSTADGVEGALDFGGYRGPWGRDREDMVLHIIGQLLGRALGPDFSQQVVALVEQRTLARAGKPEDCA